MRHSPSLNIIISILEKIRFNLERDFNEISKFQHNQESLIKFAKSSYQRSKSEIIRQIVDYLPDVNIEIIGEEFESIDKKSDVTYIISPIDSLINFSRALPFCCSLISAKDNIKNQIISSAILHIPTGDLFYASKGKGSFVNENRVRVSQNKEKLNCALSHFYLSDNSVARSKLVTNCLTLDMAYLSAGRIDEVIFDVKYKKYLESSIFLTKESGALVEEKKTFIKVYNGL
jgi:myo-inositol-1(or 4)-monophosphatase